MPKQTVQSVECTQAQRLGTCVYSPQEVLQQIAQQHPGHFVVDVAIVHAQVTVANVLAQCKAEAEPDRRKHASRVRAEVLVLHAVLVQVLGVLVDVEKLFFAMDANHAFLRDRRIP